MQICWKRFKIQAWHQLPTNRKWPMVFRMMTSLMTTCDLERWRSWSEYLYGALFQQEAQQLLGWSTVLPHKLNPNPKPITSTITRYVFERSMRPTWSTWCLVRLNWLPIVLLRQHTSSCYKQRLPTHVWHELRGSYAVIWTQVTTISDVGFYDT